MPDKDKKTLHIEKVESLDPPNTLHDGGSLSENIAASLPFGMPPAIYQFAQKRKFRLLREAKQRIQTVLLDMETWNVLWQVDGRRAIDDIATNLAMPVNEVVYHIECLRLMGIVCAVDAIYFPDFIQEKTNKDQTNKNRRQTDEK